MSGINGNVVGNYVAKGANRSGHSARVAKAAQRTPLPPKAGTPAAERWASKPSSASQVIEEMLAEARAIVAAHKAAVAAQAEADAAVAEEPSEEATADAPVAEVAPEPVAAAEPATAIVPDVTGAPVKVVGYVTAACAAGWATSFTYDDEQHRHVVTSQRGAEAITVTFVDGHWSPVVPQIFRRADGSVVRLRNASAAKKQMSLVGAARPIPTALKTTRAAALSDAEDRPQRDLPVGFLDLDDDDLIAVLRSGVRIVWRTPSTRAVSEATVLRGAPIKVEPNMLTGTKERRAVHFTEGATYRSISLRSMLQIIPVG